MENVTVYFAFIAGLVSFFSPCIFPLVPAYVAQLTGGVVSDGKILVSKRVLFIRSLSFIAGFSFIFVLLGASASFIGQFLSAQRDLLEKISGLFVILFGLQMSGILQMGFLMKEMRWEPSVQKKGSVSSFLLGVAFGAGWTPCVGLALSSILFMAGTAETMYNGMYYLFVYSLGLAIPFLLISLLLTYTFKMTKKINRYLPLISRLGGLALIALGILLFTGQLTKISAWLSQFTYTW